MNKGIFFFFFKKQNEFYFLDHFLMKYKLFHFLNWFKAKFSFNPTKIIGFKSIQNGG